MYVADGKIDISVELVSAEEGGGSLISLNVVLFGSGTVMSIAVGRATQDDDGTLIEECGSLLRDCGLPAAAGHGSGFAGADDDDELAHSKHLNVHDIGGPGIRRAYLTNIQENGLGLLACNLLRARCL